MDKLVIIDGNAIIHRAYHAIPPLTTKEGVLVNAAYGFTSMILKVIADLKPTHIACTFDMAGGSKARLERYKEYKATRVKADQALYDQIPLVHQVVEALGIAIYEKQGYEADDVIGTIVKHKDVFGLEKMDIYIVTGDMDTLQLVNHHTKVYTLRKGISDIVVYDAKAVEERFGFGPDKIVDYKAIRGDTSDNIPGVPGIGEKGATELIQKLGSIENIYKKFDSLKKLGFKDGLIKKLKEGKESAQMSYELSQIDCNVPDLDFRLVDTRLKPFDRERITPLFQKFEFISLLKRLPGAPAAAAEEKPKKARAKKAEDFVFREVKSETEVSEVLGAIKKVKSVGCRALASSADFFSAELVGLLFAFDAECVYIPKKFVTTALPIFADSAITIVGHDLKLLYKNLAVSAKTKLQCQLFDVMIASYLLQPGSRAHDAPSIILKVLGKEIVAGSGQESLFGIDAKQAAYELHLLVTAGAHLKTELAAANNLGLLEKIEMPLIPVLGEMEINGISLDQKKMEELAVRVKKSLADVTKRIYKLAGEEFNVASPTQLRDILFDKLAIPVEGIKKGKTGLSTSAEQLEKMRDLHPIIAEIESYRELAKLQNTYIEVLPGMVNPVTHRIHTNYSQVIAATGRLSSIDPNLQNIPIRTELGREIREAFIAGAGNVLVSADYSQIELRVVASLAQDKKMMEIFEKGEDIHTATAAAIHGIPLAQVTKEIRRTAKEVNFGILYGMGTHGLSWRAGISYADAKSFIDKYFEQFSGVKKYLDQTIAFTKKEGYCETLFGRRRYIPELSSTNFQLRAAGERMAVNHPIQGTAADVMKMGMIAVQNEIAKQFKISEAKVLLQVHDELLLEVEAKLSKKVGTLVKKLMEEVVTLRVPVVVDVGEGKNWGELH
jgi:DNA polymerase-1